MYKNALIFNLAHPYGTPTILSSYTFAGTSDGAPNNNAGTCSGAPLTGPGWLCQHRWVGAMVGFHNTVGSSDMTNWVSPSSQQIAFGRGALGFVVINNADSPWTAKFTTSLPSGTYCNAAWVVAAFTGSTCTGSAFTIASDGSFSTVIPARHSIALHTGAKCTTSSCKSGATIVSFDATVTTVSGEYVYVLGNITQLGNWQWSAGSSVGLSADNYPVWAAAVTIPIGTPFEYKYIKEVNGVITFESGANRIATASSSGTIQTLNDTWNT